MKYRSIIGAALLAAWSGCGTAAQTAAPQPSVLVTAVTMRRGSLAHTVTVYGVVQSSPTTTRTLIAHAAEIVSDIYTHQGAEVAPGAPLLKLTPDAQTSAAYAQARTSVRAAKQVVAHTREMFSRHLATSIQLANAQKAEADAISTLAALKAQGAEGPRILRASSHAIVVRLSVSRGQLVTSGSSLATLAKPEDLILRAGATPVEAALIHSGDLARVDTLTGHQDIRGRVSTRGATIDSATGLVPIDVALPSDKFMPGEAAKATVTVGQTQGYVVPHGAILADENGDPYVVQADGMVARKVAVHIVGSHGDEDVIRGVGLLAGQKLVLSGNYQLGDGMRIRFSDKKPGSGK